jgi:hypothetical protein
VIGTQIEADATGATSVSGVWAAGNVADIRAQVITSAAAGLTAGAAINADLVMEDARRAADAHRHQPPYGEQAWDERYRSQPEIWSGDPNAVLAAEVPDLPPGTAFDAGAGEGGPDSLSSACWAARREFRRRLRLRQVTAVLVGRE